MSSHLIKGTKESSLKQHSISKSKKKSGTNENNNCVVTWNCCKRDLTNSIRVICAICQEHGVSFYSFAITA